MASSFLPFARAGTQHVPRLVSQGIPCTETPRLQCLLLRHSARSVCPRLVSPGMSPLLSPVPRSPFPQATNQRLAALNALKWSVWSSRGAGLTLAFDAGLLLIPMLRNVVTLLRPKLVALFPADENIWFHRQVAYSMAFWTVVHTTSHYVNFFNVELSRKSLPLPPSHPHPAPSRGSHGDCPRHSLHTGRRHHWPLYASCHAPHLHNGSPQNSSPVLRGLLVYPSPRLLLLLGSLLTRYRLLRPRFRKSRLHPNISFLLHGTLSWLRELEIHHLAGNRLLCRTHVSRIPCKKSNQAFKDPRSPKRCNGASHHQT